MVVRKINYTYRNTARLRQIIKVFLKHGFGNFISKLDFGDIITVFNKIEFFKTSESEKKKLSMPERLRLAFEELGPTFVKLGQLLSTRPDYIPNEYIQEFKKLQDNVPPFHHSEIEKIIKKEYGPDAAVENVFKEFNNKPIAAASVAQVHIATLHSGEEVAVKIQRPNIEKIIRQDIRILYRIASMIEHNFEESKLFDPKGLVNEFEKTILKELDFVTEASSIEKFKVNFKNFHDIYIPAVYWDYTTSQILVIERIHGIELDEVDKMLAQGQDPKKVASIGLNCFCKQIMEDGFFHADPHPGNSMVMSDGRVALIDFGITGYLDNDLMENIANIFIGYSEHDYEKLVETFFSMGLLNEESDITLFKQDLKDVSEPFYGRSLNHINIKDIFDKIIQLCLKHNIKLPRDLLLLLKTFLQIESLGRKLDPETSVLETAKPYARRLLQKAQDPRIAIKNFKKDMSEFYSLMKIIPENVKKILLKLSEGKQRIELLHLGLESIDSDLVRGVNRITVGMIISASIMGSAWVISARSDILPIEIAGIGKISLTTLLGLCGYNIATILGVWLVISIVKSGKL
ncbi:MAG: AarF/ABC1/UbiB kinase family protein [Candidatus Firestonebacteria bacterium]|nr:AarF/ABC1/UbiB kinase family protein [Candidatus Firestonebacteria bacterium]